MREIQQGHAATLLIEGEAGIGKTRLVQSLIGSARERGVAVSHGGARPLEGTRPFGAVAEALALRRRSPDPRRASIGRLLAGHATYATPSRSAVVSSGAGPDLRYSIVEEILGLVEWHCAQGPMLLALEDLHWADSSTLLAFRSMARGLPHAPVLLVASFRPSPRPAELDALVDEALASGARFLRLEPLAAEDVDALVRAELGVPPGTRLAAMVARAGGNPLWVVEILRSLAAEGQLHWDSTTAEVNGTELPDSFRALVIRRLHYLPEATLELLQIASVLGSAVSVRDLVAVARRPAPAVVAQLGEAFRARLLDDRGDAVEFRHQLVQDAVYQDIPRPIRRALHRDAADALARVGADLSQVAGHLVLGAEHGDLEAVRRLRDAARDVVASAPSVAVALLRRAEELAPGGHADIDLIASDLVWALLRSGTVAEAAMLAETTLARPHRADVDVPVRLSLLSALSLQNRGLDLIRHAESALEQFPAPALADQSLILAQASYGRTFSGDFVGGEATARRALETAERAGDSAMTVWSLTTLSVAVKTQGRYGEALDLTRRAVGLAFDPPSSGARLRHPHFFLGMALCDADLVEDARLAYRKAREECQDLGSAWILPDTLLMAAQLRFLVGEWDEALAELEAGLRAAHEHGHRILVAQSRAYQAVAAVARGDQQAAEAALAHAHAELGCGAPRYGAELVAYAAALLAEAKGQRTRAYGLLLRFFDLDLQRENRYYHRYLAPPLVRLSLFLNEREVAQRVVGAVEEAAHLVPDVPSAQAAALRCRGLLEADPARMMTAVEFARSSGRLIDHAGACEDAASILAERGSRNEARALLFEALERYETVGAEAWATRTRAALRALGVRPGRRGPRRRPVTGWKSLTPAERAVAELIVEGLTNREVGHRLHISPHTVNTHLRHAFQKLSVSTRAGLAAAAVRHSQAVS